MYGTVVVGTDGSDTAHRGLKEAIRLTEGTLHVVAAYEPLRGARIEGAPEGAAKVWDPKPDTFVQGTVERAAAAARMAGVQVETHTATGDPADALLDVAKEVGADLIVVGNRGMHGARRVLGSVPNSVSHKAVCSVLIVATDAD